MILKHLQTYLSNHPTVSLEELVRHFQMDAAAMREVLNLLVRKGRVRKLESRECGKCYCSGNEKESIG
ncbi:FeoC-like transcriptional regulator [Pseudanabaena sp. PCC 6802]|uniref:FeoC-like transcriptional regulator n=1 Tax=Pseudanabaena sp. PCC 6802 TaxID=118173 RepID=UPI00034C5BB3|nr:FeoC-like transcriptional regulator [Pseudanabaena sp. PCC 6802]